MDASLAALPPNFAKAIELIDEAHALDPKKTESTEAAEAVPYELHYAKKMTHWLKLRCPEASPALQVACRAQHFRRWELPRDSFPMTRPGYLLWRSKCKTRAAAQVVELLATSRAIEPPLPQDVLDRVSALIAKQDLKQDEETQVLEDVACLVFLDDQFDAFEAKESIDEDKIVGILRKTWVKMSPKGHELALQMDLSERAKALIGKALEGA